jgi:transcriptional regulator with XRE-family HTH domain
MLKQQGRTGENMKKLAELLKERMDIEGMSLRQAAQKIGVSHSTVDRALSGETVEVDTLVKIAEFVGVPVENILDVKTNPDEVLQQIVMVTSMEPKLMETFAELAQGVLDGTVDRAVLAEVAAFASYRLRANQTEPLVRASEPVDTQPNSL